MPRDVFISHAGDDAGVAVEVCALLEARGLQCWMAPRDVAAGAVWDEAILDAIERSRIFLLILSSNANQSQFVKNEVNRAFSQSKPIVTFRLEEVVPGRSLELYLARHHWTDAFPPPMGARVERLAGSITALLDPAAAQMATDAPAAPPVGKRTLHAGSQPWWHGKAAMAVAAVVLLLVLAGAGWHYRTRLGGGEAIDSVAVLPFVNGSADTNMEYLSDGITESLINSLSQLPNLQVKSRDSAFHYKGKDPDPETVGRELGVRAIFKGSVRQIGDNLAISAELIDAQNDNHIWGDQYSRKASDIFALQNEIAKEITTALRTRLSGDDANRLTKSYTANPEAYQLYLQGRFWWNKRSEEGYDKGIQYFEQAIQKDPNYALAYAGLADCYAVLGINLVRAPNEVVPKAREAAQKALQIDNTLVEARPSLAIIRAAYDWDWSGAEKDFQQAIALNPNYPETHEWYGTTLRYMGRLDEAIAEDRRATELDPLSVVMNWNLGIDLYAARQYDQAIEQLRKTLELDPSFYAAHYYLGLVYVQKAMYKEALAEFEKELTIFPGSVRALSGLGYGDAVAGRRADAQKVLDQLKELSKQKYVTPAFFARIYVGIGDKEQAFESLQRAQEDRSAGFSVGLKVAPYWDPLRSDPRWAELLRRMNLLP